ncbi:MAG: hypothetical protein HY541_01445 [Deltaproteobacteria bacterium]|nr:hypothetical protein [Deltaproteobacteria bacterium]
MPRHPSVPLASGKRILFLFCGLFAVIPPVVFSPRVMADEIHLDASVAGQVREDDQSQRETPVNGYLGALFKDTESHFSTAADLRVFRDFNLRRDAFDLYQALIRWDPIDLLKLDFGRQFISQGFSTDIIDGIKMRIVPKGIVGFTLYAGVPRTVEEGDFNRDDGLLTGLSIGFKDVPRTNAQIHVSWRKEEVNGTGFGGNDEILAGANLSYQLSNSPRTLLYGLFEYDTTGQVINAGTAGVDLSVGRLFSLNTEFNYFNVNRDSERPSILEAFTEGPILSGRGAFTLTLVRRTLDFVSGYSYQWEEITSGTHRPGHLLDAGFEITFEEEGLLLSPGYYFRKSYGGTLHGVRALLHEQFTPRFYFSVAGDYAKYEKVTNHNGNAATLSLWTGYEVIKGLTLSAGWEMNRNVFFDNDVRGSFRIDYAFNHKFENKKK